jgi:3-methyladenine DNA glycosylase/8-oxoguanine DNA glycosylase
MAVIGFDSLGAVRHLRRVDPRLARTIDAVGPFRMELKTTKSLFAALTEAIVYQQLSGRAAATIHGRLCSLFPASHSGPRPENLLAAADADLRGAGLSRAKMLALRDLAQKTVAGDLLSLATIRRMEDEAIIEHLTRVRGIGRWTAEMFLMFRLGRPDVLPVDDYGVRKGFAATFRKRDLPSAQALQQYGERWKPYRTVASWYLWRVLDLDNP